jgi:hypothetical protein
MVVHSAISAAPEPWVGTGPNLAGAKSMRLSLKSNFDKQNVARDMAQIQ